MRRSPSPPAKSVSSSYCAAHSPTTNLDQRAGPAAYETTPTSVTIGPAAAFTIISFPHAATAISRASPGPCPWPARLAASAHEGLEGRPYVAHIRSAHPRCDFELRLAAARRRGRPCFSSYAGNLIPPEDPRSFSEAWHLPKSITFAD